MTHLFFQILRTCQKYMTLYPRCLRSPRFSRCSKTSWYGQNFSQSSQKLCWSPMWATSSSVYPITVLCFVAWKIHKVVPVFKSGDSNCVKNYHPISLHCTFTSNQSPTTPTKLYASLVRSQLLYCTQLWQSHLIKDILSLEQIQCRTTKYILNDYTICYRARLIKLKLLPLPQDILCQIHQNSHWTVFHY